MESRKRKREDSEPRIKYHVQQLGRSFERILKENSREELCEVVRKKLDLDSKTNLELVQIREGVVYDLEDDDDFEAFKAAACAYSSLDVRVSFPADAIPQIASNARGGVSSISDASTRSMVPQNIPHEKAAQKRVSIADPESGNRGFVSGVFPNVDVSGVERERLDTALSSSGELASPPKKKRKKFHIDSDVVTSEAQSLKKKNKRNDSNDQALDSVVPVNDEDLGPPRKKLKGYKEVAPQVAGSLVDKAQPATADPFDTVSTEVKSRSRDMGKGPEASGSLVDGAQTTTTDLPDAANTKVKKSKTRVKKRKARKNKEMGLAASRSLMDEAQTVITDPSVPANTKSKTIMSRKGDNEEGPEALMDDAHTAPADPPETTNTDVKKNKTRKGVKEMEPEALRSSAEKAPADSDIADAKLKNGKSMRPPSGSQDTHDVITQAQAIGSKKQPADIEAEGTTKKSSTKTSISVKATSESEPPARSSESHNPQAGTASNPVRLAYASFFSKPRPTASELLANYSGAVSKKVSRSNPPEVQHVGDDAVASAKAKTAAEESTYVDVAKASETDKPKPKLRKSHLSKSWLPVETEEAPSPPSNKDPSTTESLTVPDAAPPQSSSKDSSAVSQDPLTTESPKVPDAPPPLDKPPVISLTHPSNPKTKHLISISKRASPCPICLSRPFHLRFKCPLINSGDALLNRIAQLEAEEGNEDLISELQEWVQRVQRKSKGKEFAKHEIEPSHGAASSLAIGPSEHRNSPLPSWAPVVSRQSHPSEVIMESTNEGSESASSASSEEDAQSGSGSSSDGPASSSGPRSISSSTNLEQVDLDALIRGPSLKSATLYLSELDDDIKDPQSKSHSEDEDIEGDVDLLEEEGEVEHRFPKYLKRPPLIRSISPEEIAGVGEEDSVSSVGEKTVTVEGDFQLSANEEIEPSIHDTTGGNEVLQDPSTIANDHVSAQVLTHADFAPHAIREERHPTPGSVAVPEPSPIPPPTALAVNGSTTEATAMDLVELTPTECPSGQYSTSEGLTHTDRPSTPSRSRATTPIQFNTPPFKVVPVPLTPGTIRRMKDKNGHLSLNPPDKMVIQPALQSAGMIFDVAPAKEKDESMKKSRRGLSRPSIQPMSAVKPSVPRPDSDPSSSKSRSVDENQGGQPRPSTQPMSTAKPSMARSDTGPSSTRSMSPDNASSASQPVVRRRGRPALTEAVKAERKAMREAQKAAKAAETRAKNELKKMAKNDSRRSKKQEEKSVVTQGPAEGTSVSPVLAVTATTPVPVSQWTSLPPVMTSPSTISQSSPAVDELMSSSNSKQKADSVAAPNHTGALSSSPFPVRLNGVRSPGSVSLTSGSRRHDEEDVEQIVGSPEAGAAKTTGAAVRGPLFLPGASEMSQSQVIPGFVALSMPEATDEGERGGSPSGSSSASEGPSTKVSAVPRVHAASKTAFPALSQLSFDRFKPSFLLTSMFSQGQGTQRGKMSAEVHPESGEEDEEEDYDDESSETEQESSHVPKDKRAGVNVPVVRKSRSRGLLH